MTLSETRGIQCKYKANKVNSCRWDYGGNVHKFIKVHLCHFLDHKQLFTILQEDYLLIRE